MRNYEAPEVIQINKLLERDFGKDSTNQPIWRVVWSDDQYEKRLTNFTDEGLELLYPEVRELPKYKQWIPSRYVLEQLVVIPEVNARELAGKKVSYEPMFVFQNEAGDALPPDFEIAKFVIDTVNAARGNGSLVKYKEPTAEESAEQKRIRVDKIYNRLFANETDVTDHLSRQTGVVISDDSYRVKE